MAHIRHVILAVSMGLLFGVGGCLQSAPPPPEVTDALIKAQDQERKKADQGELNVPEAGKDE